MPFVEKNYRQFQRYYRKNSKIVKKSKQAQVISIQIRYPNLTQCIVTLKFNIKFH